MSRADHMLVSLIEAEGKPCEDDSRFVQDHIGRRQLMAMQATCRECPVIDLCAEVAELMPPTAGVWAGVSYNKGARHERGDYRA